jgi:lipoprotein NlpI
MWSAASGLSASDTAQLLLLRGFAYERSGQYARAVSDYGGVLYLNPRAVQVYFRRAIAYRENGQYDHALADLDAAMGSRSDPAPNLPFVFGERGVVRFALSRFTEAARDFARVLALDPTDQYGALWLHVARSRAGASNVDTLARDAAKANADQWPRPLLLLYLGDATPAQVRAATQEGGEDGRDDRRCEAAFFLGEYELLRGAAAVARPLLQEAANTCSPSLSVQAGAVGELKRIGG